MFFSFSNFALLCAILLGLSLTALRAQHGKTAHQSSSAHGLKEDNSQQQLQTKTGEE
jgi:hypothetical protein